jgi:hypothetical protein
VSATSRALALLAVAACAALTGCGSSAPAADEGDSMASVEPIKGTDLKRITLAPAAAASIGIRTAAVRTAPRKLETIPYGAVMYGPEGDAFAYVSPRRLTYVRHPIEIDHLSAKLAYLRKGPAPGTAVVTVGTAELLGNEEGVQED